jgi:hypothetical protein
MHKVAKYILDLCNYIDKNCPELFYFVPAYYDNMLFSIIKVYFRLNPNSLDFLKVENVIYSSKNELLDPFITLVTNHIADKCIPNPDQKDSFLLKLIIMLQYKDIVEKLEMHQVANEKLLPSLLSAFEAKNGFVVARTFLRLLKGKLYADFTSLILPEIGSTRYRTLFVNLCLKQEKLRDKFLNDLFSHINDLLSALNLRYADRNNGELNEREENMKEARTDYETLYNMLRVLETVISLVPLIFLEISRVLKQRASDLCMLIIREVTQGHLGSFLLEIPSSNIKKIETPKALLCPIAGIYLILSKAAFMEKTGKFVSLEEFTVNADGFDINLMKKFIELLKGKAVKGLPKEFFTVRNAVNSLEMYIARHPSTVQLINNPRTNPTR